MIEGIRLHKGIWSAYAKGTEEEKLIETKSYREFRSLCAKYGLFLPNRDEVVGMKSEGHYFERGGWRKLLVRH